MRLPTLFHLMTGMLLLPPAARAQNLLANPSFEDVNVCIEYYAPCAPVGWENVSPALKMQYNYHTYKNKAGHQYINLVSGSVRDERNYAQTRLLCPMRKGKRYRIMAIVGATQRLEPEVDFYLSKDYVFRENAHVLNDLKPTVTLRKAQITKPLEKNFYRMETVFTAEDDFTHLLVGRMELRQSRASGGPEFIFLDYLELVPEEQTDLCADAAAIMDSLAHRRLRHTLPGQHVTRQMTNVRTAKNGCMDVEIPGTDLFTAVGRARYPLAASRIDSLVQRYQPGGLRLRITGYFFDPASQRFDSALSAREAIDAREVFINDFAFSPRDIKVVTLQISTPRYDAASPGAKARNNFVGIEVCPPDISAPPETPVAVAEIPPPPDTLLIPDVLFKFDRHELNPALFSSLDTLVDKIPRAEGTTLALIGHTDNAGADDYNLELSLRRAEALAAYLRKKGLGDYILTVSGEGEKRPAHPNDSPEGRRRNRRVEIIIYKQ
ncbi:OmpA family protein [Chitinophaga sp.]|uniref:OmpA family protein n=1 Tax=Chitinophaga sp. TaxID=1869181 RepID=UPI002631B09E|nr:OmpA family protein [uncultured Chitinophaga sp.]